MNVRPFLHAVEYHLRAAHGNEKVDELIAGPPADDVPPTPRSAEHLRAVQMLDGEVA